MKSILNQGEYNIFLASDLADFESYFQIKKISDIETIRNLENRFNKRFICLPKELFSKDLEEDSKPLTENFEKKDISLAPLKAPLSSFNDPDYSEEILVSGKGLMRETLACFKMISS